jgi:hypothetical protein
VSDAAKDYVIQALQKARDGEDNKAASAASLAEYRAWFDSKNGNVDPHEAKEKILSLNMNFKDMQEASNYAGKYQTYSQREIDALVKKINPKASDAEKGSIYTALMRDSQIINGGKLDSKTLENKVWQLMQKGVVVTDEKPWYSSTEQIGRSSSKLYEAIDKGQGGSFRLTVPKEEVERINVALETMYPFYTKADGETKQIMREVYYYKQVSGRDVQLTPLEKSKIMQAERNYNNSIGSTK